MIKKATSQVGVLGCTALGQEFSDTSPTSLHPGRLGLLFQRREEGRHGAVWGRSHVVLKPPMPRVGGKT
jgi:hypothetical protein